MARPRAAFTLIELLVVISIIAVLASMLLPAISMVRAGAKSSACTSSLRQIGMAVSDYATGNDGLMPDIAVITGSGTWRWAELIADSLEAVRKSGGTGDVDNARRSVLTGCPEWIAPQTWMLGFGMNMYPDQPKRLTATHRWDYRPGNTTSSMVHFTLSSISNTTSRLMVADAEDYHTAAIALTRHSGRFNALFFDGHTQSLTGLAAFNQVTARPDLGLP